MFVLFEFREALAREMDEYRNCPNNGHGPCVYISFYSVFNGDRRFKKVIPLADGSSIGEYNS
jgi:hypothetical protein